MRQQLHQISQSTGDDIDLQNFKWLLVAYDMPLDSGSLGTFIQQIDGRTDCASIACLLNKVIRDMSASRQETVCSAYSALEARCQGTVCLKDIATQYNPSQDPHVMTGSKSEEQVFNSFMKGWETKGQQDRVSGEEFCEYYKDISAAMEREDHFEYLIRNAWNF